MVIFHGFLGQFTRPGNHHVHHGPSRAWPIPWFQVDKNTLSSRRKALPSGNLTVSYWKHTIYSWFTYSKWWFSIAMLVYQRVIQTVAFCWTWCYHGVSMPVNGWQTIHGLAGILSESEETDQLRHQTRIKPVSDVGNFTAMAPINMCTQIVWFRLNKHILSCIYI